MPNLILKIQQVVGLVQLGLTTVQAIVGAVSAGRTAVTEADGEVIPPDALTGRLEALLAHAGAVGDAASARVEGRVDDDV